MSKPLKRRGETVLLTGATGYVGSVVAEKLRIAGYLVRGLTRSAGKAPALERKCVAPIVGDVKDAALMAEAAKGVSAIVHTASPNAPSPGESLEQIVADSVRAAELLADLAAANRVRLIVTSGASMYGPTHGRIVDEAAPLGVPPFATPLAECETVLAENGRACIIRLGVVYGGDQSAPVLDLIEKVRSRGAAAIVDASNRLSLVHVDDLADLYIALLEEESPPAVVNAVASIASWSEVMSAIATAADVTGELETIGPEEAASLGGPAIYMAIDMAVSGELARRRLGWQPTGPDLESDLAESL